MLQKLMQRRQRGSEEGFTLIELMVVVLIIAILIAIAIPTFLGARARAQNRAAQSGLRNSLTAAKTLYTDQNDYSTALPGSATTGLQSVEPSLTYVAAGTASTDPKTVSVTVTNSNTTWSAAAMSKSGTCYTISDTSTGPGTVYNSTGTAANCTGTWAAANPGAAGSSW
jgi:type IV pilus assembly protein PilA